MFTNKLTRYLMENEVFGPGSYRIKPNSLRRIKTQYMGLNRNWKAYLTSPVEKNIVIRCYSRKYETSNPQREIGMYYFVRDIGIPVPKVFHFDDSRHFFPYVVAIMEYIDGESFFMAVHEHPELREKIIKNAANVQTKINSRKFNTFGLFSPLSNGSFCFYQKSPNYFYDEFFETRKALVSLKIKGYLSDYQYRKIFERFLEFKPMMSQIQEFSLVHGDWHGENIRINDGRVAGVFDWEWSGSAHWMKDLVQWCLVTNRKGEDPSIIETYRNEYGRLSNELNSQLFAFFSALRCFISAKFNLIDRFDVKVAKSRLEEGKKWLFEE
jgi:hypothetical protein